MKLFKKINIMNWVFQFEFSIKKRDRTEDYHLAAESHGWFIDLPSPGRGGLRFAKYSGGQFTENGMGEYMNVEFSNVSTWEELCTEQNISLKQNSGE